MERDQKLWGKAAEQMPHVPGVLEMRGKGDNGERGVERGRGDRGEGRESERERERERERESTG